MARSVHYTTATRFAAMVSDARKLALFDLNRDGVEDDGAFAAWRDKAENYLDRNLRQKYSTPFSSTSDVADEEDVADLADLILHWLIEQYWRPDGKHAEALGAEVDEELLKLRDGVTQLKEADAPYVSAEDGKSFVKVSSNTKGSKFAGRYSDGVSKMRGW